jgi:hypothetical protein
MQTFVPLLAAGVSLVFALAVLDQFFERRRDYLVYWAIGLFAWSVGTFSEFLFEAVGAGSLTFRLWYLSGAVVTAAWLGMGTVALLAGRRRWVDMLAGALILATILAYARGLAADVNLQAVRDAGHLTGEAFPDSVRLMTPFFNVFGTVALVGGAAWSAIALARRRTPGWRVQANVLIAVGSLLPAIGGSFSKAGQAEILYLTELAGAVVIFLGFLRSQGGVRFYPFLFFRQQLDRIGLPDGLQ